MVSFRWLSNLMNITHSRTESRRPSAKQPGGVRLQLEELEDRMTPSGMGFELSPTALFPAMQLNPGLFALLPAMQSNPTLIIGEEIINQIPYLQTWTSHIDQMTGFSLPGISNMLGMLDAQFPILTDLGLNGKL